MALITKNIAYGPLTKVINLIQIIDHVGFTNLKNKQAMTLI